MTTTDKSRADALTRESIETIARKYAGSYFSGLLFQDADSFARFSDEIVAAASPVEQHEAAPAGWQQSAEGWRRGIKEAFNLANIINANRVGRTSEERCSAIVRGLADLANGAQPEPSAAAEPAAPSAPLEGTGNGAEAWMTDDGRVISNAQKQQALRDGGASASSVRPFSIALSRAPRTDVAGTVPEGLPHWFDLFLTNVCELPDRNSPEGEPDAIVATLDELRNCAVNAIEQCVSYAQPPSADAAAAPAAWQQALPQIPDLVKSMAWLTMCLRTELSRLDDTTHKALDEVEAQLCCVRAITNGAIDYEAMVARAAASQPAAGQTAPVCWITKEQLEQLEDLTSDAWVYWRETGHVAEDDELALYTAPPAQVATRQELTDEQPHDPADEASDCGCATNEACKMKTDGSCWRAD
ncbi:hypothetical protein [Burkholderia cepacia]|uniref:hypothetical protein n=1 Tax=Burkholderia cepacia TaxID=292 RepID=UPI001CF1614E|nr:hypothetical protein [Burkholderia cepacia]MCA8026455.1 hypothetical protein [Burkholderia cepacia]